jgi:hypothetical protein
VHLQIRITPLRAGTAEPVDEPRLFPCPPDLEPDQILSFLVQFFDCEPIEVAWTRTERHERINLGWIFAVLPGGEPIEGVELMCVPVIDTEDGSRKPLVEVLADQRQDFEHLAASGAIDSLTIVEAPQREYHPRAESYDRSSP